MAVIGQPFGVGGFENRGGVTLVFGDRNQHINLVIFYKSINRFKKVIFCDEIELCVELAEHGGQFFFSFLQFFRERYIYILIDMYDMQFGMEHFQYGADQG